MPAKKPKATVPPEGFVMHRLPDNTMPDALTDNPGTFAWHTREREPIRRRMVYVCPKREHCGVPILPDRLPNGAGWQWDGNEDQPTLTPSINCVGGCGWHGFITKGVMR